jgi:hypothetical protein
MIIGSPITAINGIIIWVKDQAIFCVGGDFNLPDIDWKTGLVNGNNYPRKTSEEIIKSVEDMFMEQVVECSTRGENILDLFFTTNPTLI